MAKKTKGKKAARKVGKAPPASSGPVTVESLLAAEYGPAVGNPAPADPFAEYGPAIAETPDQRAQRRDREAAERAFMEASADAERNARYQRTETDAFLVTIMSAERVPQEVIARCLNKPWGISKETMLHHYPAEALSGRGTVLSLAYGRMLRDIGTGAGNPGTKEGAQTARFLAARMGEQIASKSAKLVEDGTMTVSAEEETVVITFKIGEGAPNGADDADAADENALPN